MAFCCFSCAIVRIGMLWKVKRSLLKSPDDESEEDEERVQLLLRVSRPLS